ncbi:MAG TPA: diguanylate cyclase [Syntrophus sp. (in: bacteria)]|nr:diguanylate cyclase [Syntrophus sp. (in: bacteria)]
MKVCFAVQKDEGMDSAVFGHFGSAPAFMVVDTERQSIELVNNKDMIHAHGACNPIMALGGQNVGAVVVGGIGGGALMKLNAAGIRVYGAMAGTVKGNLDLLMTNSLRELSMENTCAGHQGGCGH